MTKTPKIVPMKTVSIYCLLVSDQKSSEIACHCCHCFIHYLAFELFYFLSLQFLLFSLPQIIFFTHTHPQHFPTPPQFSLPTLLYPEHSMFFTQQLQTPFLTV